MILSKAPRPYRVLCVGEAATSGQWGQPGGAASLIDYVERMAERMSPHYEFMKAASTLCSVLDFDKPYDAASNPLGIASVNGAYELLVEPRVEGTTGIPLDLATVLLGVSDAAGYAEDAPTSVVDFVAGMQSLTQRLLDDHIAKVLILLSFEYEVPYLGPPVAGRVREYRDALTGAIPSWDDAVSYLDLFHWFDSSIHIEPGGPGSAGYPNQLAHDRIAVEVGRYIRQSTHYQFLRQGGPGVITPFKECDDYQPQETP